nr:hypothetical protein [Tanacetum cinerariifolium]
MPEVKPRNQETKPQESLLGMDVKSAFLYGRIKEEVYVCQPLRFKDPGHPNKVYKVVKALYGLHQAPRACQDKYVTEVLRKFNLSDAKTASTPVDTEKPLVKDTDGDDIDVHLYRSMIRSLMYVVCGEGSTVLVESHHTPLGAPTTSQPPFSSPSRIPTRQETEVPQPSSPTHTHVADEAASTGVDVRHGGPATTITSLDAGQGSGNIDKTPSMPYDLPLPRVNTLGSDEGSMTLQELTILCTTLSQKVESLEANLKQTKQVYEAAYTKLIMKVERLEKTVKISKARRQANIVVFVNEEEFKDPSKQGRREAHSQPDNQLRVLSAAKVLADAAKVHTYTRRRRAVNTGSDGISTASRIVSTAGASMPVSTASMIDKARVEADEELTQKLQAEEGDKYSEVDQAKMLLKKLSFDEIKELFEATMRSINDFVPMESVDDKAILKLAEAGSSKRDVEEELEHEGSKKKKTSEALGLAQEQPGIDDNDILDGMKRGYQELCLGEMFCVFKQKDDLGK